MIKIIFREGYKVDRGWQREALKAVKDFKDHLEQREYFNNYFKYADTHKPIKTYQKGGEANL